MTALSKMIVIEFNKLKNTLVIPLCIAVPTVVAIAVGAISARQPVSTWGNVMLNGVGLWAYFMLPMAVTALSALMAHIEHRNGMWDHLLALPIKRWRLFAAKAVVMMCLLAAMSLLLAIEIRLVGNLFEWFLPKKAPLGTFSWLRLFEGLTAMWAAALLVCMLQLWVALHFRSFVVPIVLGLTGTFITVIAAGAREAIFVPWVTPVSVLINDGARMTEALTIGIGGGTVLLILMIWHLSRQEA